MTIAKDRGQQGGRRTGDRSRERVKGKDRRQYRERERNVSGRNL